MYPVDCQQAGRSFIRAIVWPPDGDLNYVAVFCADGVRRYAHADHVHELQRLSFVPRETSEPAVLALVHATPSEALCGQ